MDETKDTDLIGRNGMDNYEDTFDNLGKDKEERSGSIKNNDEELDFSKHIHDNEDMRYRRRDTNDEIGLSGDEKENPFEELERIHDSKIKEQIGNEKEEWIENYISEKGEEFGARITGSRLIESGLKQTVWREGGTEPVAKGRMGKDFNNEAGRRPIDLQGMDN